MSIAFKMGGYTLPAPDAPSYSGNYSVFGDNRKGYMILKSSGTLSFKKPRQVDVFMLAAGTNGGNGANGYRGDAGTGGTGGLGGEHDNMYSVTLGESVPVVIGNSTSRTTSVNNVSVSGTGQSCYAFNGDYSDFSYVIYATKGGNGGNGGNGGRPEFNPGNPGTEGTAGTNGSGNGGKGGKGGSGGTSDAPKYVGDPDPGAGSPGADGENAQQNTGAGGGAGGGGGGGGYGCKWDATHGKSDEFLSYAGRGPGGKGGLGGSGIAIVRWGY